MTLDRFLSIFRSILTDGPSELRFVVNGDPVELYHVGYDVKSNTWTISLAGDVK